MGFAKQAAMPPLAYRPAKVASSTTVILHRKIVVLGLGLSAAFLHGALGTDLARSGTSVEPYIYEAGFTPSVTINVPRDSIPNPLHAALTGGSPQQTRWRKGYLDITQPPYNAVIGTGTDNADAIQKALHDGYYYNMTVYIPSGTFQISRPLTCNYPEPGSLGANLKYCSVIVGSATGARSVLKYTGTGTPAENAVLTFQYVGDSGADPTRLYGATLRCVDLDMGNAPTMNGIDMTGSQNCDIEDVKISGTFNAGISGIPASGGSINGVTVIGGNYGILSPNYRPSPTLCGITLIDQSMGGVKITNARGPVNLVGFNISNTNAPSGYIAVSGSIPSSLIKDPKSDINLVDGQITVSGSNGLAVKNFGPHSKVAMDNVYIKAATIIQNGSGSCTVTGTSGAFSRVEKYIFVTGSSQAFIYDETEGTVIHESGSDCQDYLEPLLEDPPEDLVSRHLGNPVIPIVDANTYSVTSSPYSATLDNPAVDDSVAINAAISAAYENAQSSGTNTTVILPRGQYYIAQPITLKDGVNLVGGGKNSSVLVLSPTFSGTTLFTVEDVTSAVPAMGVSLQDFGLWGIMATTSTSSTTAPYALKDVSLLRIQNPDVNMRDVVTTHPAADTGGLQKVGAAPIVEMEGNAGGHFYNLCVYKFEADISTTTTDYHLLHIKNTSNPIYLYGPSIEHQTVGGSQIQLDNAQNVHFLGLKAEGQDQLLQVNNSFNCSVFGVSSEFSSSGTTPLIQIDSLSDQLWFSQLDRLIKDSPVPYPWIVSGTDVSVPGTAAIGLYKQGSTVVVGDGFMESLAGTQSNFDLSSAPSYAYAPDDGGAPCLKFRGSSPQEVYCNPRGHLKVTKGYQVSVRVKMNSNPTNSKDTPTLIFLSNDCTLSAAYPYYSVRIEKNGKLMVAGPDINPPKEPSITQLLNGGATNSAVNWNRLTVRVKNGVATIFVNGRKALVVPASGLATAQDCDFERAHPISIGVTGQKANSFFKNFGYYPAR
ncbi:hypothetical protein BH09VER1_BH09VER1_47960 [soil metagenome]